ncbi:hypothetical protein IFM89_039024 [Coptis chinensis]|uniref:Non-specific serine/threonine protein kinase n=1 Tax=Coptis chinensis TaxID=261450 RepID=A0A835M649_9MAGN|nr:hypothetical protein IFM89_039024 [Coptis chinensis]
MLSGDVPEGFSSLSSLRYLKLTSNAFSGEIPKNLRLCRRVIGNASLSNNRVFARFQPKLGNYSNLEVLEFRSKSVKRVGYRLIFQGFPI